MNFLSNTFGSLGSTTFILHEKGIILHFIFCFAKCVDDFVLYSRLPDHFRIEGRENTQPCKFHNKTHRFLQCRFQRHPISTFKQKKGCVRSLTTNLPPCEIYYSEYLVFQGATLKKEEPARAKKKNIHADLLKIVPDKSRLNHQQNRYAD